MDTTLRCYFTDVLLDLYLYLYHQYFENLRLLMVLFYWKQRLSYYLSGLLFSSSSFVSSSFPPRA